ncbi:ankyrin repeat domain-containing protein [Bordetella genomosp. 5]|uniref:Uncharacterized protein n=1 Tax=Bordetella genomosp. 5 TaxID=1395608 RepID=A0A261TE22_9BORD|nr:ankyrin repeat domain-containing protein [Bordetella genomosp. 5]OZI47896.1 hypothetical protein CAL25_16000 [Bordetella genomosp. 5]
MAKAKKKLLPKNFDELLEAGDHEALKAVFETCALDARGGYSKQTALAFNDFPDALVRWLVEQGADIGAVDSYGETPLHARAGHWQGRIEVLLDLGADVNAGEGARGTPLQEAAGVGNAANARLLLARGARVDALNAQRLTPLEYALQRCSNTQLCGMAEVACVLLDAGAARTPRMTDFVTRLGENFEFHRANFDPDSVAETSAALDRLYALFDVPPVPRRVLHDGKTPIVARAGTWEDQHQELWELLVPSSGAAATVQGEVIRVTGKIHRELYGNGGVNWGADFRAMADALLVHLGSGAALPAAQRDEAATLVAEVKRKDGDTFRLCELAVAWVALNPKPVALPAPAYKR